MGALCAATGLCTLLNMTLALAVTGVWYLVRIQEKRAPLLLALQTIVTAFLRSRIQPGDPIWVTLVSNMSVQNYFRKAGIPPEVLSLRKLGSGRLFAIEDKLPVEEKGNFSEHVIMSNIGLVMRIEGDNTDRLPPQKKLLWELRWLRLWLYEPATSLW